MKYRLSIFFLLKVEKSMFYTVRFFRLYRNIYMSTYMKYIKTSFRLKVYKELSVI